MNQSITGAPWNLQELPAPAWSGGHLAHACLISWLYCALFEGRGHNSLPSVSAEVFLEWIIIFSRCVELGNSSNPFDIYCHIWFFVLLFGYPGSEPSSCDGEFPSFWGWAYFPPERLKVPRACVSQPAHDWARAPDLGFDNQTYRLQIVTQELLAWRSTWWLSWVQQAHVLGWWRLWYPRARAGGCRPACTAWRVVVVVVQWQQQGSAWVLYCDWGPYAKLCSLWSCFSAQRFSELLNILILFRLKSI